MKNYIVTYVIKANNKQTTHEVTVAAKNAKDACSLIKAQVKRETGRNAFRPVAKIKEN